MVVLRVFSFATVTSQTNEVSEFNVSGVNPRKSSKN